MIKPKIDILLPTYNGIRFVSAQLESIFCQTDVQLRVLARDDGSTDGTEKVLETWAKREPERFLHIPSGERLGAKKAFAALVAQSNADYIAFSDQDDVWMPKKLAKLFDALRTLEISYPSARPILVHCDLKVANEKLEVISRSFWKHSAINPQGNSVEELVFENTVTGCACLFNRALANLAFPMPEQALMHDHWLALCASGLGKIGVVDETLVVYRQHSSNVVGARLDWRPPIARLAQFLVVCLILGWKNRLKESAHLAQASAFHHRFSSRLSAQHNTALVALCRLPKSDAVSQRRTLVLHRFLPRFRGPLFLG